MTEELPAFLGPYRIGSLIYRTLNASVYESFHVELCEKLAIKCIKKGSCPPQLIEDECQIMRDLKNSQYTIHALDIFETDHYRCIVMPLAVGGDLFEYIARVGAVEEVIACQIMHQAISALVEIQKYKIWHRDIKPENFLLMDGSSTCPNIVLADFGYAKHLGDHELSREWVGTPLYSAPEILLRHAYGRSVDIYSMGVTMYVLLSGESPFTTDDPVQQEIEITSGIYDFNSEAWDEVSSEAKDLIRLMMARNPEDRISAEDALSHPWFMQTCQVSGKPRMLKSYQSLIDPGDRANEDDQGWADDDMDMDGW